MNPNFIPAVLFLYPDAVVGVDWIVQDDGAGPFLAHWGLPNPPPTDPEIAAAIAQIPAAQIAALKAAAKAMIDADQASSALTRAMVKIMADKLTEVRQWLMDFQTAVATANNFQQMKDEVITLPALPDLSMADVVVAIKAAIDAGV